VSKFRHRPRHLQLEPRVLNERLRDYQRGIDAANAPSVVGFHHARQDAAVRGDWFTVVNEDTEYLVCTRRGTAMTVHVSKPQDLRQGLASATFGGDLHEITPAYAAGNIIQGMSFAGGHGHVSGSTQYEWFDLNTDGRQWARIPT